MKEFQPKKLRIVQKNMEKYTGPIGPHLFENGVSIQTVSYMEAQRIGAMISVVDASDNHVVNPGEDMMRNMHEPVDSEKVKAYNNGEALVVNPNISARRLSRSDLEGIADKEGLNGVREVARKWGRTGRSIQECIEAVLDAQKSADVKEGVTTPEEKAPEESVAETIAEPTEASSEEPFEEAIEEEVKAEEVKIEE